MMLTNRQANSLKAAESSPGKLVDDAGSNPVMREIADGVVASRNPGKPQMEHIEVLVRPGLFTGTRRNKTWHPLWDRRRSLRHYGGCPAIRISASRSYRTRVVPTPGMPHPLADVHPHPARQARQRVGPVCHRRPAAATADSTRPGPETAAPTNSESGPIPRRPLRRAH